MSGLPASKHYRITRGDNLALPLRAIKGNTYLAYNLTAATQIICRFVKQDGTMLELSLTDGKVAIIDPGSGKFQVVLSQAETAQLKPGEYQDFESVIYFSQIKATVVHSRAITVRKPLGS